MRLISSEAPPFLPDPEQHSVLRLGLSALAPDQWLRPGPDFPAFHRHKLRLVTQYPGQVYQTLPGSEPAQEELRALLINHLLEHHPEQYQRREGGLVFLPTALTLSCEYRDLFHTALLVPEDLCILQALDGEYVLTAGSVCCPSNWRFEEKIGRPLTAVHGPVPGYGTALAARVDRLMARLTPGKPLLRYNWSIQRGNELCWRDDHAPPDPTAPLYWRVERQTLRRLPSSGAIVFGIRIFLHSFTSLAGQPQFAPVLRDLLARLPAEEKRYKNLPDLPD